MTSTPDLLQNIWDSFRERKTKLGKESVYFFMDLGHVLSLKLLRIQEYETNPMDPFHF